MNYDPFRNYDQWKTASPYDDDPDCILEGLIPRFPVECPICRYNGNAEHASVPIMAEWYEHATPGDDEFNPEMECGWHCKECDWQQECEPEDWQNDATVPYAAQIANLHRELNKVRDALHKSRPEIVPLEDFNFPDGDFCWDDMETGDWHVYCCGEKDCPIKWHQVAYAWTYKREDGVLSIECHDVDEDGNWDFNEGWEKTDEPWEDSCAAQQMATESDDYFIGWADYWLHCASSMTDPLEQANHGPHTMKPRDWITFCLKAAAENISYADSRASRRA